MLAASMLSGAAPHAAAQTLPPAPEPQSTAGGGRSIPPTATRADLQDLLETLRDPAKRDALAAQIETLLEVRQAEARSQEETGAHVLGALSSAFQDSSRFVERLGRSFGASGHLLGWLEVQGTDPRLRAMWLETGKDLVLSLGAGIIASTFAAIAVNAGRQRLAQRAGQELFRRICLAVVRLILEFLPAAAFGLAVLAVASGAAPISTAQLALLAIINAVLLSMIGAAIARFLFCPTEPRLRLFALSEATAAHLYTWSRRLIVLCAWGYIILQTALLLGLPPSGYMLAAKLLGLVITAILVILVLQNRENMAHWIRDRPVQGGARLGPGAARNRIAEIWHVAIVVCLVGIYALWAFNIADGLFYLLRATALTALVIAVAALGEKWLRRLSARFSAMGAEARHPLVAVRANRYAPVLRRLVVYAVWITAALLILAAWRVDIGGLLFGRIGRDVLGRAADIVLVLVLALAAWEILGGIVYARLSRHDESGYAMLRSGRARTLLPLMRNVLMIFISVMATLMILSELGVDIAPLLAGAGVVGLAVGFGAQSLVKDVISGAFFLFEGTINVGDVVDVNGTGGLVEGMTIRSIRLRGYNGNLHTVNFGSVGVITNMTRDFSYYVCDVKVAFRYDVDAVIAALREADEGLRKDKSFRHDILEPIEIAGVESFADTTFLVRSRIKTRPIRQWDVGREFLRRLKRTFEAKDIQLAVPGLPAYVVVSDDSKKNQLAAAVASRRRRPDQPPAGEEPAAE